MYPAKVLSLRYKTRQCPLTINQHLSSLVQIVISQGQQDNTSGKAFVTDPDLILTNIYDFLSPPAEIHKCRVRNKTEHCHEKEKKIIISHEIKDKIERIWKW